MFFWNPHPSYFLSRSPRKRWGLTLEIYSWYIETSPETCRGSPSRKPSRFVASPQLHLLHLCISAAPFSSILHLTGRGENAGILGVRSNTQEERKKLFWNHFDLKKLRNSWQFLDFSKIICRLKLVMTNRPASSTSRHAAIFGIFGLIVLVAQVLRTSSEKIPTAVKQRKSPLKSCMWQHTTTLPGTSRQLLNAISFNRCLSLCPQQMIWSVFLPSPN